MDSGIGESYFKIFINIKILFSGKNLYQTIKLVPLQNIINKNDR